MNNTRLTIIRKIDSHISFDAVLVERHDSSSTVSDNPIETGETVTDHITVKPDTLEIIGKMSNVGDAGGSNSIRVYDALMKLRADRKIFSIQTGLRLYENMAIVSISTLHDAKTDTCPEFTCKFREIKIVGTQYTRIDRKSFKVTSRKLNEKYGKKTGRQNNHAPDSLTKSRMNIEQRTADRAEPIVQRGNVGIKTDVSKKSEGRDINRARAEKHTVNKSALCSMLC